MTYTADQLKAVVPSSWVHHTELRRIRFKNDRLTECCSIQRTRLCWPRTAWQAMGSPSNVTLFFQGQDVLMLPSSGYRVTVFAHHCALVQKRPCFLQYLLRGVYHRPSWMIGDWQGLPVLRVKNACFTYVSRKWLTSWHDLEEQPGGNS